MIWGGGGAGGAVVEEGRHYKASGVVAKAVTGNWRSGWRQKHTQAHARRIFEHRSGGGGLMGDNFGTPTFCMTH